MSFRHVARGAQHRAVAGSAALLWVATSVIARAEPPPLEEDTSSESAATAAKPDKGGVSFSLSKGLEARAPDGLASLQFGLFGSVRAESFTQTGSDLAWSMDVRTMRPRFQGFMGAPWMQYFVQADFAGSSARLLDFYLQAQPVPGFGARAGRFKMPFGYPWARHVTRMMFPESGPARDYFDLGRDTGGMIFGTTGQKHLSYAVAGAVGQPVSVSDDERIRNGVVVVRLEWAPAGALPQNESPFASGDVPFRILFGLGGYYGRVVRSAERLDPITLELTTDDPGEGLDTVGSADVSFAWERISGAAELTVGRRELRGTQAFLGSPTGLASTLEIGTFVWKRVFQLATRLSYLDPNLGGSDDVFESAEGQLAAYALGLHLVFKLRYGVARGGPENHFLTLKPGFTHLLTLQAQMSF